MFRSLAGLLCFAALAWCVSGNRRGVRLRMVICGLLIMTYAMCGFANPGSLGIMIG